MAIRLAMCAFLLAVGYNNASILNGCRDMEPERYRGKRSFLLTWRHQSFHHSTPHVGFPIGCQRWPYVYLVRLLRYSASKILHALCHVTCRQGVKNDHIFGIPVGILPMHYTTFMGLRWGLRGIHRRKFYTRVILSKIFQAQFWAQISTLGIVQGSNTNFESFNPQKAHPCVRPRRFSHRARKSAEGSDLQMSFWKKAYVYN